MIPHARYDTEEVATVDNFDFSTGIVTPSALAATTSWRGQMLDPISDHRALDTYVRRPFNNSIATATGAVPAVLGRGANSAAEQAAPPRGIPR